jgi:hypothetical protein
VHAVRRGFVNVVYCSNGWVVNIIRLFSVIPQGVFSVIPKGVADAPLVSDGALPARAVSRARDLAAPAAPRAASGE